MAVSVPLIEGATQAPGLPLSVPCVAHIFALWCGCSFLLSSWSNPISLLNWTSLHEQIQYPSFEGVICYWGGRESIFVFCATLVFNKHFFMSHTWKLGVHRKSMSIMTLPDSIHEWLFHHGNSDCSITPFREFIIVAYFCDHFPWVKPCFYFGIQPWSPWHTARGTPLARLVTTWPPSCPRRESGCRRTAGGRERSSFPLGSSSHLVSIGYNMLVHPSCRRIKPNLSHLKQGIFHLRFVGWASKHWEIGRGSPSTWEKMGKPWGNSWETNDKQDEQLPVTAEKFTYDWVCWICMIFLISKSTSWGIYRE